MGGGQVCGCRGRGGGGTLEEESLFYVLGSRSWFLSEVPVAHDTYHPCFHHSLPDTHSLLGVPEDLPLVDPEP